MTSATSRPARPSGGSGWRLWLGRLRAAGAQFFATASFTRKWLVLGAVIGVIAGVGAVVFYQSLQLATHFFLGELAGYRVPTPAGEGNAHGSASFARPWAIPLVAGGGGLISAFLVFRFAPDAEGHGTDAAISAVHENPRGIRFRTVIVKIVASAVTIGSGGSGGREGPTGQISAGFASLLARIFDLSPADARVAVASGIGSGIGSIFSAPLGGAVLAAEILYRDDFEFEALLPSFIASTVGYAVFGAVEGYGPLFGFAPSYELANPLELGWFALIGVLGGLVGLLYAKGFYGIGEVFARSRIPRWYRPAIGGVLVGCMALAMPQVIGTGYGWIQRALSSEIVHIPLWIVLLLPLARIVATGLSIGSGGSGGIFGPGMVIGAFLGGAVWDVGHRFAPSMGHDPAPYVIVGMMSCFGGISRAPLAVMLMVAEMTGTLTIVVPAMLAVGIATLIVRRNDDTIYRSQLKTRAESPAHRILTGMPLLYRIPVAQAMAAPRLVLESDLGLAEAAQAMRDAGVKEAPVVDTEGRYLGAAKLTDLDERIEAAKESQSQQRGSGSRQGSHPTVGGATDTNVLPVQQGQQVDAALETLTTTGQSWAPVVDPQRRVIGTLAVSDMVKAYRRALQGSLRQVGGLPGTTGIFETVVEQGSAFDGHTLSSCDIPRDVIVTSIDRGRTVVIPEGRTVLQPGDRLTLLSSPEDAETVAGLARQNGSAAT